MGNAVDGRLPEDHRRARRRSAQQHRRRGARQDRLRAPDQLHRRRRHQRRAAVPDDARDHAHEGVHGRAREPGQAARSRSARFRRRPGWSISSSTTRPAPATRAKSTPAVRGTRAATGSSSRRRRSRTLRDRNGDDERRDRRPAARARPAHPEMIEELLVEQLQRSAARRRTAREGAAEDGQGARSRTCCSCAFENSSRGDARSRSSG